MTDIKETASHELPHVGVDLAKNVIQIAYRDLKTGKFINKQLSRSKFKEFICDCNQRYVIAMEACGACHYWARLCKEHGHEPMIIPSEVTHGLNIGNKDDHNDARTIWQASSIPDLKLIRCRSEENQVEGMLLKLRDLILKQQTQLSNFLRAQLYELGVACNMGQTNVAAGANKLLDEAKEKGAEWSEPFEKLVTAITNIQEKLSDSEQTIADCIIDRTEKNELCERLRSIPYVGPMCAAALANVMGDPHNFSNGRQFADYCGMAPYHTGTGGKVNVLGIADKGNRTLKRVLYEASLSLYCRVRKDAAEHKARQYRSDWILNLMNRKPTKKAVCAIANRLCRIAWAAAAESEGIYDPSKTTLVRAVDETVG